MDKYILKDYKPILVSSALEWAKWFEGSFEEDKERGLPSKRHVAYTTVDDWNVSTVFLGLDHSFSREGPPLLFETMVFGSPLDGTQYRWDTWGAALLGHERTVAEVITTINGGKNDG